MGRNWLVYPLETLEYKMPKQDVWANDFEDDIIDRVDAENWFNTLTNEQKAIVELMIDNMTYEDIGDVFGIDKMAVCRKVKLIKESYQKYFK